MEAESVHYSKKRKKGEMGVFSFVMPRLKRRGKWGGNPLKRVRSVLVTCGWSAFA